VLPTITPNSNIVVTSLGRQLVPMEKLLLHGFPVHCMRFPPTVSDRDIESLGGNTMHLACVGAAILLASALVDWTLPQARLGSKPPGAAPSSRGHSVDGSRPSQHVPHKVQKPIPSAVPRGQKRARGTRTRITSVASAKVIKTSRQARTVTTSRWG